MKYIEKTGASMKYKTFIFCSITSQDFQNIKVKVELFN